MAGVLDMMQRVGKRYSHDKYGKHFRPNSDVMLSYRMLLQKMDVSFVFRMGM